MKAIIMLVLGFAMIIMAAVLYNSGPMLADLKPYKAYFWIPIALSFLLFTASFLQKDNTEKP